MPPTFTVVHDAGRMSRTFAIDNVLAYRERSQDVMVHLRDGYVCCLLGVDIAEVSKSIRKQCPVALHGFVVLSPRCFVRPQGISSYESKKGSTATNVRLKADSVFWVPLSRSEMAQILAFPTTAS